MFDDGYALDMDYALECCKPAANAGVTEFLLCDTNISSMPWDVCTINADDVVNQFGTNMGIHVHNDCGMAVANIIMAARNDMGFW